MQQASLPPPAGWDAAGGSGHRRWPSAGINQYDLAFGRLLRRQVSRKPGVKPGSARRLVARNTAVRSCAGAQASLDAVIPPLVRSRFY
jgi:hypothetical protein